MILVSFFYCIPNLVQMLIPSEYKRLVDLLCNPDMQDNVHDIFNDRDIMPTLFHRILKRFNQGDFSDKTRFNHGVESDGPRSTVPRLLFYPLFLV